MSTFFYQSRLAIGLSLYFLFLAGCGGGGGGGGGKSTIDAPEVSLSGGTYTSNQSISIHSDTDGAHIYYTLDGSLPTKESQKYSGPVLLSSEGEYQIRAIAVKSGANDSDVIGVTYDIVYPRLDAVTFNKTPGEYTKDFSVELSSEHLGSTIFYTLDGSIPTENSNIYVKPIEFNGHDKSAIIKAIAFADQYKTSDVSQAEYRVMYEKLSAISMALPGGVYNSDLTVSLSHVNPEADIYYTLDGSTPTADSLLYESPIQISGHGTVVEINSFAIRDQYIASDLVVATYQIEYLPLSEIKFETPRGVFSNGTSVIISGGEEIADIYYTLDGSLPTVNSELYSGPIELAGNSEKVQINAFAYAEQYIPTPIISREFFLSNGGLADQHFEFDLEYSDDPISIELDLVNDGAETLEPYFPLKVDSTFERYIEPSSAQSSLVPSHQSFTSDDSDKVKVVERNNNLSYKSVIQGEIIVKMYVDGEHARSSSALKSFDLSKLNTSSFSSIGIKKTKLLARLKNKKQMDDEAKLQKLSKKETVIFLVELEDKSEGAFRAALKQLNDDPQVIYAEPNLPVELNQTLPNDDRFPELFGLHNDGESGGLVDADIDAPEAWSYLDHVGAKNIRIGVLDTGVDYLHPDLIDNMWTNPGEIPGNGIDDDGNGYIDDVHGYDVRDDDGDPMDIDGHGTHVAGTIAARGNNQLGVTGVMWDASLVAIRWIGGFGTATSHAIAAVEYANVLGLPITNNSWHILDGYSQALKDTIEAGDSLFVVAAGNDASDVDIQFDYPVSYDSENILSVASLDHLDELSSFSNWAEVNVDVAAYGSRILSTMPGDTYGFNSGTSMAAPQVAGIAGFALTYAPDMSIRELKNLLMDTTESIPSLENLVVTGGKINALNVAEALSLNWLEHRADYDSLPFAAQGKSYLMIDPSKIKAGSYSVDVRVAGTLGSGESKGLSLRVDMAPCKKLSLEQASLDFGEVVIGSAQERVLVAKNECNTDVMVHSEPINSPAGVLSIENDDLSVSAFGEREFVFKLVAPASVTPGEFRFNQNLQSDAWEGSELSFEVSAVIRNGPLLELPDPIVIEAARDEIYTTTLTLNNIGDMPLEVEVDNDVQSVHGFDGLNRDGVPIEWIELSQDDRSTSVSLSDDDSVRAAMGFSFPYFGNSWQDLYISSNGFVSFDVGSRRFVNAELPSLDIPESAILPFWDDLDPVDSRDGAIYYRNVMGQVFVVQYDNIARFDDDSTVLTFQLQLFPNGDFAFLYKDMDGLVDSATVGYQFKEGGISKSDMLVYNADYVESGKIAAFLVKRDWLSFDHYSAVLSPGTTASLPISINTSGLESGEYLGNIVIVSNSRLSDRHLVPIRLIVRD